MVGNTTQDKTNTHTTPLQKEPKEYVIEMEETLITTLGLIAFIIVFIALILLVTIVIMSLIRIFAEDSFGNINSLLPKLNGRTLTRP